MSEQSPTNRLAEWILDSRQGALALTGAFLAVCLVFVFQLRFLHDEGVFSHYLALSVRHDFWAGFFFLKTKPPLMLLYSLPSLLGLTVFLITHAILGAATVWLTCATARRLEIPHANLAGIFLATSMSFMVAASNGFSNLDGCFFLALFCWLYFTDRKLLAGLVCGLLPFVRHELALVSGAFFLFEFWRGRSKAFWLGCLGFPLFYWLSGALYHQNLTWLLATFPNPQARPAEISGWVPSAAQLFSFLLESLLISSPLLLPFAALAWRRKNKDSLFIFGLTVLIYLLMTVFQTFGIFGFDFSLRYHVAPLPLVALLAAAGLATLAFRGKSLLAAGSAATLILALALSWHGRRQHHDNHLQMEKLKTYSGYHGQAVYIDDVIARYDHCARIDRVVTLADESTRWEIHRFTNRENGQYQRVIEALEREGFLVESERHTVDQNAVYLFRDHPRTLRWRQRLESANPRQDRLGDRLIFYWTNEESP